MKNVIISINFLFFSSSCFSQKDIKYSLHEYFKNMNKKIEFIQLIDNHISIQPFLEKCSFQKVEYIYKIIDSNSCLGILNNYFSFKNKNRKLYENSNQDKYLVGYFFDLKKIVLYLNTSNLNFNKKKQLNFSNFFMPNQTIYAFVFDFNHEFIGEFTIFNSKHNSLNEIKLAKTYLGKNYSKTLSVNCKLTYEKFQKDLIGVILNTKCILNDFKNIDTLIGWDLVNSPKDNFYIQNWKKK